MLACVKAERWNRLKCRTGVLHWVFSVHLSIAFTRLRQVFSVSGTGSESSDTLRPIVYQAERAGPPDTVWKSAFLSASWRLRRYESALGDTVLGESCSFAGNCPMAVPIQLPLFPDQAALIRIRPERNEWRYYRIAVWPDLFGRALLARQWGRIGTQGRVRLDPHPDAGAAINALARLAHAKRRPGYRDRPW